MPKIIDERIGNKSVAVKNKLFIVGGGSENKCEVFDSTINKFTLLKKPTPVSIYILNKSSGVITTGSKLLMFCNIGIVIIYDFENDVWSEQKCKATKNLYWFSCAKLPVKPC